MPQTNNESEAKIPAKRRKSPRRRWKRALLLLVLLTLLILRVERNVTDVVLTLSQATARSLAIQALNEAASEMLGLGVHYADLMTVEKDDQGQVRLIQANTPEMNRLAAQASLLAQERLTAMGQKTVVVPLGSAIGLTLLAGSGPRIPISIVPVGSVQTDFETEFEACGINQTRHEIRLVVDVYVSVLLPGFSTVTKVTNRCAVAETVIVGSVPDTYTYFDTREDMSSTAEDFIMNNAG